MNTERLWRGGRMQSAARIGVPAGAIFALLQLAQHGSVAGAVFAGLFFAVFFGAVMALLMWRSWRGAGGLESAQRMKVVRIVERGEEVDEARIAPAVLEYVDVVRKAQDRDRRHAWVLWIFAAGTLSLAIGASVGGQVRSAVVSWSLTVFWAMFLINSPRKRARRIERASFAEASALKILERPTN